MIKGVLSDLGNVVVFFSNQQFLDALNRYRRAEPLTLACFNGRMGSFLHDFCRGRIGALAFRRRVFDAYFVDGRDEFPTEEQFYEAYAKVLTPNRPVLDLWQTLNERGYVLTAVSDIDPLRHRECRALGVFKHFHHAVLSYEERESKQSRSRQLLMTGLQRSQLKPDEVVFIDDTPEHLVLAEALGISTHQYRCDNGLLKYLRDHGMPVD